MSEHPLLNSAFRSAAGGLRLPEPEGRVVYNRSAQLATQQALDRKNRREGLARGYDSLGFPFIKKEKKGK